MPRTHGMGKGKGPRPKSKQMYEDAQHDDGAAAGKLLVLSELVDPRKSKWKPINKADEQEIYDRFVMYLQFCQLHGFVPFWMGFCCALGYDSLTVTRCMRGETKSSESSRKILKGIHELFQQNIVDMQGKGEIRDIVGMFWLKALNPKFWAVEVTKNDISVSMNIAGNSATPEQLQQNFVNAIDVPFTEKEQEPCVLPIPAETRNIENAQTYNEYTIDGHMSAQEKQ